jgi:hypothetical protein
VTDDLTLARQAFQRRLLQTPGVVATPGDQVACSLYISAIPLACNDATEANFKTLRTLWETPTGLALTEAVDVWRHARELSLGLHYEWDPPAPSEWLNARRTWAAFVRETLRYSRTLDTELQVANAVRSGEIQSDELNEWALIRPSFTPNPVPRWHDESALAACQAWLKHPGIVWCEHTFFAEELAKRSGCPYYGARGETSDGATIEDAHGPIIASVAANSTGRNLQRWHRNLVTSCPSTATTWEQLIGRTHRDGQAADEVTVDVLVGCFEHLNGMAQARESAQMALDMMGQPQKLLLADMDWPDVSPGMGYRWAKN